ncbi:MAG: iron-only hydrogenase system regulator [Clostridia bacterium]|nr:iron-only hydrogenase system regulator [Clostridia bacterium]
METRLAIVSIFVEDRTVSQKINALLAEYGDYIKGRMGLPYPEKMVNVLAVVVDAPLPTINSLTGKLGMIEGVSAKTLISKV